MVLIKILIIGGLNILMGRSILVHSASVETRKGNFAHGLLGEEFFLDVS